MPKTKTENLKEKKLYQALSDGIANEEILNIKGYSNEDLRKILDYQDKLLNETDNGTAFESIHENSISDLKKFASGQLSIDSDSYETMKEFIRIFGTNYKGELTPEGQAAQNKLDRLIEEKKQKILQHKKATLAAGQKKKKTASPELLNTVESVRLHKIRQAEKENTETPKKNLPEENDIVEFAFGMAEEKEPVNTVEYSFGMTTEPQPDNTIEYSFGMNIETQAEAEKIITATEEKKKREADEDILGSSAPAINIKREKPQNPVQPVQAAPKKVVMEKDASDDLLDQIIDGSTDLNDDEIAAFLNEEPKKKSTPDKKQPVKPQTGNKKKKQPTKNKSKKNFFNKIKVWGIAAAVAFCSYLGFKTDKKEYKLDMPDPAKTEIKTTANIDPDSLRQTSSQKPGRKAEVKTIAQNIAGTKQTRELFPELDNQEPIANFYETDRQNEQTKDDIDLQYEIARNKLLSQRNR